jgi:16S rRNA (adenine1518-N6/adenine1519-N6)-dimethyltransferase
MAAPARGRSERDSARSRFVPTKARGQNFLVDGRLADRLVAALGASRADTVVEVGAGTGALTRRLLAVAGRVVAIESDRMLAELLRQELAGRPGGPGGASGAVPDAPGGRGGAYGAVPDAEVWEADFLALDLDRLAGARPLKLISNVPYSITGPLVHKVLTSPVRFERIVLTLQKEVAQRLAAPPGTRAYGRLTVLVRLHGELETLFDLPPGAFRPRPRVVSRAVALRPWPGVSLAGYTGSSLDRVVRAAFGERRKRVGGAIARALGLPRARVEEALARAGVAPGARAEDLAPETYVALARDLGA